VHFGLGGSTLVRELEVRWPSGVKQVLHDIKPDRIVEVKEP
jgi:hypothetical protein